MRRLTTIVLVAFGASLGVTAPVAAAGQPACFDASVPLTTEEGRLAGPIGPRLINEAGFDHLVGDFRAALCSTRTAAAAEELVDQAGRRLWDTAVDRAQGRRLGTGTLDALDDRPLYWTRLRMSADLRQWTPSFAVRRALLHTHFDHASRGLRSITPKAGVRRALISGFDPFGFDIDVRLSNPSGAVALLLDGKVVQTPGGPVAVEAVQFPVTWQSFTEGIVESAFGPSLASPATAPDVLMTISQGAGFTVEQWAAGWRGGGSDNNGVDQSGPVPAAPGWPASPSTLIETTLPHASMVSAATGPREVWFNPFHCYWPAGTVPGSADPQCRFDGERPQPGDQGEMGGGGSFLSNESMFRANRLRLGLGADAVRGGHLHIPPVHLPEDPNALTDEVTEAARHEIVAQTSALVGVAATAERTG